MREQRGEHSPQPAATAAAPSAASTAARRLRRRSRRSRRARLRRLRHRSRRARLRRLRHRSRPSVAASFAPATLEWIGLDGEDAAKVESAKKWRDEHGITLASKYIGTGDEILAALNAGQQFDIAITFNPYIERSAIAKLIQPLDTSRLQNWNDMFDGLRNSKFLNVDGKPYGAPIAWGDGPVVYDPKKVPSNEVPASIVDLYDVKWKKRLTMSNDPAWLFHLTAISMGFTKSPLLTKAELQQVADKSDGFVKQNVVSFAATYADAVDLLVRGEVDLSLLGWEAMLNFAKDKGSELAFGFLKEGKGGWSDSYCIPASVEDVDQAYAYIDAIISPQINADVAVALVSGTVNTKGVALIPRRTTSTTTRTSRPPRTASSTTTSRRSSPPTRPSRRGPTGQRRGARSRRPDPTSAVPAASLRWPSRRRNP